MTSSKQELNWIAVQEASVPQSVRKDWDNMVALREKVKAGIIAHARAKGAIGKDETLAIAFKPWGFSMAKTAAKGTSKGNGKDVFADL